LKEHDELIGSRKKQTEEMSHKAEQWSMQMQGVVQELAVEEILRNLFPVDLIEEVRKFVRGAAKRITRRNYLSL
jgi:hypothetical protein